MSGGGAVILTCADSNCQKSFVILGDGITVSPIGCGETHPELQPHPREGTPSHGTPDTLPQKGGEHFHSRGIGAENGSCFVCNVECIPNIAAFVQCRDAGERIEKMFGQGAWMDYRDFEPDRVQVKIGACKEHLPALEALNKITRDGHITMEHIVEAKKVMGK